MTPNSRPAQLAVIACIFSPRPHERRRKNFETFRQQLGQNLYVAELSYEEHAWITQESPSVLHLRGGPTHVLWQKERLLNVLLERLPRQVTAVAWVDADILFVDREWPMKALKQLEQFPVIQLFDTVVHLDAAGFPQAQMDGIIAAARRNGPATFAARAGATGFAWAARRDFLEEVRFLDCMILGGADTYMACAFAGIKPSSHFEQLPPKLRHAVEAWSNRVHALTGGKVGYSPGTIEHLFHGGLHTRGYLQRYQILKNATFNPSNDLFVDECGLYTWKSRQPHFHTKVALYFEGRAVNENK